jgi:hypothetical protein
MILFCRKKKKEKRKILKHEMNRYTRSVYKRRSCSKVRIAEPVTCMHVCMYVHTYVHRYVQQSLSHVCICKYVCMFVHRYLQQTLSHVCIYSYMYIQTFRHTYRHTNDAAAQRHDEQSLSQRNIFVFE